MGLDRKVSYLRNAQNKAAAAGEVRTDDRPALLDSSVENNNNQCLHTSYLNPHNKQKKVRFLYQFQFLIGKV